MVGGSGESGGERLQRKVRGPNRRRDRCGFRHRPRRGASPVGRRCPRVDVGLEHRRPRCRSGRSRARPIPQAVDIAAEDAVDAAMQRSLDALGGRLDILVASAGITGPNGALKDYAGNDWRKVFDVNVNGVFYCNRAAVRAMDGAGYGRIVNVASVAGKEGNPNASAYSASKAAVIALTKSLGKETATTGIRVNCITPAAIKTALFDQMTPQHIEFMLSKIPVGTVRHH